MEKTIKTENIRHLMGRFMGLMRRGDPAAALKKVIFRSSRLYGLWLRRNMPGPDDIADERKRLKRVEGPLISIVVPMYDTNARYLKDLMRSVHNQTYPAFELLLCDGSKNKDRLRTLVRRYSDKDSRIIYVSDGNSSLGISENINMGIRHAKGDIIAFLDHDDTLSPTALKVVAGAYSDGARLMYSDEDKLSQDGKALSRPVFKEDFDIDILRRSNYMMHFLAADAGLAGSILMRPEYDGAQDYDFILRCAEACEDREICHIALPIYHWRMHDSSTSVNAESKRYAFEAGKRALMSHFERLGIKASVNEGDAPGWYRCEIEE